MHFKLGFGMAMEKSVPLLPKFLGSRQTHLGEGQTPSRLGDGTPSAINPAVNPRGEHIAVESVYGCHH